jgi:hypothetical protein
VVQVLPGQQPVPAAPHTVQRAFLQMVLASLQVELVQQGPPAAPQTLHVLVELSHAAFVSLQPVGIALETEQQASPRPPQVLQA